MTLIDYLGERHTLAARTGMSLVDVCARHGLDLLYCDALGGGTPIEVKVSEDFTKDIYGEGTQDRTLHVWMYVCMFMCMCTSPRSAVGLDGIFAMVYGATLRPLGEIRPSCL